MKNKKNLIIALVCAVAAVAVVVGVLVWRGNAHKPEPSGPALTDPTGSTAADPTGSTAADPTGSTATQPGDTDPTGSVGTEPATQPSEPAQTEPATQPSEPAVQPTEPPTQPTEHVHKFVETVIEPTCVDEGYSRYECACGEYYLGDDVKPKGHDWTEWTVIQQPTTTESGSKTHTCNTCGTKEDVIIPIHEHTYTSTWVEPTCEKEGRTVNTCSCGRTYISGYAPALGHDWPEWQTTVEPTTSSTGERTRTCNRCKKVAVETVPALDPATGEAYVHYIDPRIETLVGPSGNVGYLYGEDCSVTDYRTWGEPPSIWINEDGSWRVVYFDLEGNRVEVLIELPPEDYIRDCSILEDGTYTLDLIGSYAKQ